MCRCLAASVPQQNAVKSCYNVVQHNTVLHCSDKAKHTLDFELTKDTRNLVGVYIETVSPEGTFCDTVQIPSSVGDMELI